MPKQNPFGKIGEDSPPETPTKKGNEPEPERTLLIKHDVCVYRIPPQVSPLFMVFNIVITMMWWIWIGFLVSELHWRMKDAPPCVSGRIPPLLSSQYFVCRRDVHHNYHLCHHNSPFNLHLITSIHSRPKQWAGRLQTGIWKIPTGKGKWEWWEPCNEKDCSQCFLSRWVWDQEQRSSWKRRRQTGRSTQSVRLRPILVWLFSLLQIQAGRKYFHFYFFWHFWCEFAHFLSTQYQLSEHQVFCDQSDGGGEDGVPWSRLLRPSRQLRREHHPPRPLQGDQGLLSLNKFRANLLLLHQFLFL